MSGEARTYVSIPDVEANFEASRSALIAMREAIEQLQGLRAQDVAAIRRALLDQSSARATGNVASSSTTPVTVPGLRFDLKRRHTYRYRYMVAFRTKAGNLDIGVAIKRPGGAHVKRVTVTED